MFRRINFGPVRVLGALALLWIVSGCGRVNPVEPQTGGEAHAAAVNSCGSYFCTLDMGSKYYINNNTWGANSNGGDGWEAIWVNNGSSWGSVWDWTGGPTGGIKAFPSAVLGWHWGWKKSGTDLPTRIWNNANVNTNFNFSVQGNSTLNVAYDLWFHNTSNPDWSVQPTDEIMVWLYKTPNTGAIGSYQGTVWIAGAGWNLYRGTVSSWNVFSFVRQQNTTNATLNLRDFIHHIVYSRGWMSNAKYLTGVQAGSEVTYGSGQINVNNYYCNIQ